MVEVTESDRKVVVEMCRHIVPCDNVWWEEVLSGAHDYWPPLQVAATHREAAAKAERDRLRELPEQIAVLVSDRAILLLDIPETDGRLSRLCDEIRQALADALESQHVG